MELRLELRTIVSLQNEDTGAVVDGGENWQDIPVMLDQSLLSDEAGIVGGEQFTGAFVGMSCNDLSGKRKHADFDFFTYEGKDNN